MPEKLHQILESRFAISELYPLQGKVISHIMEGHHALVVMPTGSGKSLTYLVPIYDAIMRDHPERHTVRAIIIYPMNALINSQLKALEDYAGGFPGGLDQKRPRPIWSCGDVAARLTRAPRSERATGPLPGPGHGERFPSQPTCFRRLHLALLRRDIAFLLRFRGGSCFLLTDQSPYSPFPKNAQMIYDSINRSKYELYVFPSQ